MSKDQNDLDWVACQYLLGELSEEEASQFELQMADDEASCAALARAVELLQLSVAAKEVEQPTVVIHQTSAAQPALWWSSVAVACLVCVGLFHSFVNAPRTPDSTAGTSKKLNTVAGDHLAITWSQTPDPDPATEAEIPSEDQEVEANDGDDDDNSWVMVAISGIEMHHDDLD